MLSIVEKRPNIEFPSLSVEDQYHQWQNTNKHAYQAYKAENYTRAASYFADSLNISQTLKERFFNDSVNNSGISMLYFSSHNLSACLNATKKSLDAKRVLKELHEYLLEVVTNRFKSKKLRLEALSYLDKSLFSLSSQLGYINEVENIHALIRHTETIATEAEKTLIA